MTIDYLAKACHTAITSPPVDFNDKDLMANWRDLDNSAKAHAILCVIQTWADLWFDSDNARMDHAASSLYDADAFHQLDPSPIPFPSRTQYWRASTTPRLPNGRNEVNGNPRFVLAPPRAYPYFKESSEYQPFYMMSCLNFVNRYKFTMDLHRQFIDARKSRQDLSVKDFVGELIDGKIKERFASPAFTVLWNEATQGTYVRNVCLVFQA
jgi:hypothetical protein